MSVADIKTPLLVMTIPRYLYVCYFDFLVVQGVEAYFLEKINSITFVLILRSHF